MYDYVPGKVDWTAHALPIEGRKAHEPTAGSVARADAPTCALDDRLDDVRSRIGGGDVCVVLNEAGVVAGILRGEELGRAGGARAEDVMRPGPSTYRPDVPIEQMVDAMTKHDLDSAPVTRPDGTLVGVLFRSDAIAAARAGER